MLLGDHVLANVAEIWRHREAIERQAAEIFASLTGDFIALGVAPTLVELARQSVLDERRHAVLCRELVELFEPGLSPLPVPRVAPLGPGHLTRRQRALYTAVALSCVTETLSTALLVKMFEHARDPQVRSTVHEILRDEIGHSRVGWAYLALEAGRVDVAWIGAHVPSMIADAVRTDLRPTTSGGLSSGAMRDYGILPRADVDAVVERVMTTVIRPGLERFGVLERGHSGRSTSSASGHSPPSVFSR